MRKTLFVMFLLVAVFAMPAFAQGGPATTGGTDLGPIAAAFGIAFAAGLAALGQGKVAGSVAESLARNPAARPGIQIALFLGLAFIESLVLFTFVMILIKVK